MKEAETARPVFGRRDPDARGYFGAYGGRFVPETLVAPIEELTAGYYAAREDDAFCEELDRLLKHYVGRPTPLYEARNLARAGEAGRAGQVLDPPNVRIFLKREDLTHTGAHKINNALGQALLAKRMGKRRVVAETGAGQHGVATATACALLGLECRVYMGTEDMRRQALNVVRMQLLGATVHGVDAGSRTLKDAINEAMRDWVANVTDTYYLLGSALGPHPYPLMVREFQSVIGREARSQILEQAGRLPDVVVACVGGGSNAIGIFDGFLDDKTVRLIGVEAGGERIEPGRHAARFAGGSTGVLQGTRTFVLQDDAGSRTLKDAINEAMRDWVANVTDTYYLLGSALGPHPYPLMVREFQSVIGREARAQILQQAGRLPDVVVACVGGGSNAIGIFDGFLDDQTVRLIGVEAGGEKIAPGRHAARFAGGSTGVLQGTRTFVLQDDPGNIELTHSISAGLDYAAVGPEHAWLRELGRTEYAHISDAEALDGFKVLARLEGILPALESSHAIAYTMQLVPTLKSGSIVLVNLSGRGDKDVQTVIDSGGRVPSDPADAS